MHPFLSTQHPMAFAHRGGTGFAPENTVEAFSHAASLGYRYLETDVHTTADGVLVAFHDDDLRRTCGIDRRIAEMTIAEIEEVRVGGTHRIPRFDELIESFPGRYWNIDCKADSSIDALVAAVRRHALLDRCCIGAFSDRRLVRIRRRLGPRLCTSFGPAQTAWWWLTGRSAAGADCAQVPTHQWNLALVNRRTIRGSRVPIIVWTIDDPTEMHRLLDLGVDGLMTDRPDVLKAVLSERGTWSDHDAT